MKLMIPILTAAFALGFVDSAYAESCASVEREMVYGRIALEDAKEKKDFLESSKQFEAAVGKAPSCAAAHFNLGVVYEKAGEYQKALNALKKYLSLAPGASDAGKVQKKIYELEYRAKKESDPKTRAHRLLKSVSGTWDATWSSGVQTVSFFTVSGDRINFTYIYEGREISGGEDLKYDFNKNRFPGKQRYEFRNEKMVPIRGEHYIWVRSDTLMEEILNGELLVTFRK